MPDEVARIFRPFEQVGEVSRHWEGTGLIQNKAPLRSQPKLFEYRGIILSTWNHAPFLGRWFLRLPECPFLGNRSICSESPMYGFD